MKNRIKLPQLKSREEFFAAVDDAARISLHLRGLEAERDDQIQKVQDLFGPSFSEYQTQLTAAVAQAEAFAEAHQCELMLGKARSAETALARYGFRTGMPQLKLKSKVTWGMVVNTLLRERRSMWLRTKIEAAKDAIIAACQARAETAAIAERIGMKVVQEEAFYIEPKVESADQVKAAAK
jgi:phage host-nuclease inhibitor protein Gam